MAEPFLSEIRLMSFNFAPTGWAMCNGQLLPINQNQALFSLLSNRFGGDGQTTFALPDMRGRVPIHVGAGHTLGQLGGEQTHTLALAELPSHSHQMIGSASDADVVLPTDNLVARTSQLYAPTGPMTILDPSSTSSTGGSQGHPNMQPFLTLSFCIALQGIFPSPN